MENKYNLDFYETMEVANGYVDRMEDDLISIQEELGDDQEVLEAALFELKNNNEHILHAEDMLNIYLENNDYQSVCNQLIMNEVIYMFYRDVLPDSDMSYIYYYLDSISEDQLIEDVTNIIDKYNGEEK